MKTSFPSSFVPPHLASSPFPPLWPPSTSLSVYSPSFVGSVSYRLGSALLLARRVLLSKHLHCNVLQSLQLSLDSTKRRCNGPSHLVPEVVPVLTVLAGVLTQFILYALYPMIQAGTEN